MRRAARAAAALLCACSGDIEPAQPLLNQCSQQFECAPQDTCDPELKLCVRERVDAPYPVAFQVVPSEQSGALVDRLTLDTQQLQSRLTMGEVRVPKAVVLSGRVLSDNAAREAALTFVPRGARPYLSTSIGAQTLPSGGELRWHARLEPNVQYDVRVYPLGSAAALLPPHTFQVSTATSDGQVDLTYGGELRQPLRGKLLDVNAAPQSGRKLRLRRKTGGETVSSLATVQPDGSFTLYAPAEVLAQRSEHELQVGLETRREPWLTSLAVDGARLRPDGNVIIPAVPAPVRFISAVEVDDRASAAVTFQSRFAPPSAESVRVNGRDWCRGSLDAGIACGAELTVPLAYDRSDPAMPQRPSDRRVQVDLLPGDYQVYVQPVSEDSDAPPAATTAYGTLSVETQPDAGPQAGYTIRLDTAKVYTGRVRSPLGKPMPFVTITAQALGLPGSPSEVGAVGRYNRTAEALSDRNGEFRLSVDRGYYDFVATPPSGSGFSGSLWANRIIDDVVADLAPISPDAPIIAQGTLLTSEGLPVAAARVDAFAVVRDLRTDGQRAVRIGQAISNDAGVFVLQLPARVLDDPGRDAGMDGGVNDLDAGVAR